MEQTTQNENSVQPAQNVSVRQIVGRNLSMLRQEKKLTQSEVAALLCYSDKAVSKWERGESLPDVEVLLQMARLYGVTLDYLVSNSSDSREAQPRFWRSQRTRSLSVIIIISVIGVLLLACLAYVVLTSVAGFASSFLLTFLYAVPVCLIVWLVLNSVWFRGRHNLLIISLLMWSLLVCLYLSFLVFAGRSFPLFFILGVPGQVIILCCSQLVLAHSLPINVFKDSAAKTPDSGKY